MPQIKQRPIVLSAKRRSWRMLDAHADEHDRRYQEVREKVLQRDDHTCVFCLFRAPRHQHVHHLDDDHGNNKLSNLVTACALCHQCFHLGMAGVLKAATVVWLPEIRQAELNNLCRAIFVAVANGGEQEQSARSLYVSLESRAAIIEHELGAGASNPASFGQAFLHMSDAQYAARGRKLAPIHLLPRMQGFGAEIEFWRQDKTCFGAMADVDWDKIAYPIEALDEAADDERHLSDPLLDHLVSARDDLLAH